MYVVVLLIMVLPSTFLYAMENTFTLMLKATSEQREEDSLKTRRLDIRNIKVDGSGMNMLHWAASQGHVPVMKVLVEQEQFDVNAQTRYGLTALDYSNDVPAVEYLLHAGARVSQDAFMRAMYRDSLVVAKFLLERNWYQMNSTYLTECFYPAIKAGDVEMCKLLLARGVRPIHDQMRQAVWNGQVDIITAFERHNIDIVTASNGCKGLKSFATLAYLERNETMLKKVVKTVDAQTFREATYDAWPEGFKILLESDVKPDRQVVHDMLLNAINEQSTECIAPILDSNILSVQLIDIITALASGNKAIINQLLSHCVQSQLNNLLVQAVETCNPDACQVLLDAGAQRTVRTKEGLTLLHVVVEQAEQFHITEHAHTHREDLEMQRKTSIDWLKQWKDVLTDSSWGLFKATTAPKKLFEIVGILLLTPGYKDLQEHKAKVREMLTATLAKKYDKKHAKPLALNPYEMAKRRGLAHVFVGLLDPDQIDQWQEGIRIRYHLKN